MKVELSCWPLTNLAPCVKVGLAKTPIRSKNTPTTPGIIVVVHVQYVEHGLDARLLVPILLTLNEETRR